MYLKHWHSRRITWLEEVIFIESRAKLLGHPIHQQLIVFPLGLLASAVIFDLIAWGFANPGFMEAAFYMIGAGVVAGLLVAVFGLIDWLAIPSGTRAKRIGAVHGIGNVVVVLLFASSFLLRWPNPGNPPTTAFLCAYTGACLALVTGWLGGELVTRLGIGVDDRTDLNAPSSLSAPHGTGPAGGPPERFTNSWQMSGHRKIRRTILRVHSAAAVESNRNCILASGLRFVDNGVFENHA